MKIEIRKGDDLGSTSAERWQHFYTPAGIINLSGSMSVREFAREALALGLTPKISMERIGEVESATLTIDNNLSRPNKLRDSYKIPFVFKPFPEFYQFIGLDMAKQKDAKSMRKPTTLAGWRKHALDAITDRDEWAGAHTRTQAALDIAKGNERASVEENRNLADKLVAVNDELKTLKGNYADAYALVKQHEETIATTRKMNGEYYSEVTATRKENKELANALSAVKDELAAAQRHNGLQAGYIQRVIEDERMANNRTALRTGPMTDGYQISGAERVASGDYQGRRIG